MRVNDRVQVIAHPEQTGTVTLVGDSGIHVVLDRPISLGVGTTLIDSIWRDASELVELDRAGAMLAIATEVMTDPEWTARVVVAALMANDQLDPEHPAFTTLVRALTNSQKGLIA